MPSEDRVRVTQQCGRVDGGLLGREVLHLTIHSSPHLLVSTDRSEVDYRKHYSKEIDAFSQRNRVAVAHRRDEAGVDLDVLTVDPARLV